MYSRHCISVTFLGQSDKVPPAQTTIERRSTFEHADDEPLCVSDFLDLRNGSQIMLFEVKLLFVELLQDQVFLLGSLAGGRGNLDGEEPSIMDSPAQVVGEHFVGGKDGVDLVFGDELLLGGHVVGLDLHILGVHGDVQVAEVGPASAMIMDQPHHAQNQVDFQVRPLVLLLVGREADDVERGLFGLGFDGEGFLLRLQNSDFEFFDLMVEVFGDVGLPLEQRDRNSLILVVD